jgi:hypothetical protein
MSDGGRKESNPWWLLLLTLLGGAALFRAPARDSGTKKEPAEAAAKKEEGRAQTEDSSGMHGRLRGPLRKFLGFDKPDEERAKGDKPKKKPKPLEDDAAETAALKEALSEHVNSIASLLVTVADPVETQSSYRFDMQIETLHRALAVEGFVPDNFYLPWTDGGTGRAHYEPGVLLYRRLRAERSAGHRANVVKGAPDLLLVYLVGEIPTQGLHKQAFLAAINEMEALSMLGTGVAVPVAGPTFSGTAESLATAIRVASEKYPHLRFRVLDGSALGVDKEMFLRRARRREELSAKKDGTTVTFHCTLHSVGQLEGAITDYLRQFKPAARIAWLKESGTGYGLSSDRGLRNKRDDSTQGDVTVYSVPLNIARARATYEESVRSGDNSQPAILPDRFRLPIPFDEASGAHDLPPLQTPKLSAAEAEAVLAQSLASIRDAGTDYVGIAMTDVRDPIFIGQMVKQHCPNSQLVLVTADLLYLHAEFRDALSGAIVVSSHSLVPEEQDWCFPYEGDRAKIVLNYQSYYGLHNAVVLLRLEQSGKSKFNAKENLYRLSEKVYRSSIDEKKPLGLLGYGPPLPLSLPESGVYKPPIWISMLSPSGLWPLTTRNPENETTASYTIGLKVPSARQAPPPRKRIAGISQLIMAAWTTFAILYVLGVANRKVGKWREPLAFTYRREPLSDVRNHGFGMIATKHVFRLLMSAAFLVVTGTQLLLVSVVVLRYPLEDDQWAKFAGLLWLGNHVATAGLLVVVVSDVLGLFPVWLNLTAKVKRKLPEWAVAPCQLGLVLVSAVSLYVVLLTQRSLFQGADSYFRFLAWTDLWNGISLLLVLHFTMVAVIAYAYGLLLQIDFVQEKNLLTPPEFLKTTTLDLDSHFRLPGALLFPLRTRLWTRAGIAPALVGLFIAFCWMAVLGTRTAGNQFGSWAMATVIAVTSMLWCWRFVKCIVLAEGFLKVCHAAAWRFGHEHSLKRWREIVERNPDERFRSLTDLLFTPRPLARDPIFITKMDAAKFNANAEEEHDLQLVHLRLYLRQFLVHLRALFLSLIVSGGFLFLAANAFPINSAPFMRLTVSLMLLAVASAMLIYYLRFDRDAMLSLLVGTTPGQIAWNWSLLITVAPMLLIILGALFSQAFPETWGWVRDLLQPLNKSFA